jgi:hypothetical protein
MWFVGACPSISCKQYSWCDGNQLKRPSCLHVRCRPAPPTATPQPSLQRPVNLASPSCLVPAATATATLPTPGCSAHPWVPVQRSTGWGSTAAASLTWSTLLGPWDWMEVTHCMPPMCCRTRRWVCWHFARCTSQAAWHHQALHADAIWITDPWPGRPAALLGICWRLLHRQLAVHNKPAMTLLPCCNVVCRAVCCCGVGSWNSLTGPPLAL